MGEEEFGGRLVLRDGTGEVDLVIDIDGEMISLRQGDQSLGQYPISQVVCTRWDKTRIVMSFAGESVDFYPLRPDEFIATLQENEKLPRNQ